MKAILSKLYWGIVMLAADKRILAEKAIAYARVGSYEEAARIRQKAYAKNPPGSIGVDWRDWRSIWVKDKRYLAYLNAEKFSDLQNSKHYIESMKASIFIDYLFDFRDGWGIEHHRDFCKEEICCPSLDEFLDKMDLKEEARDLVYMSTIKRNISSKMYIDATKNNGLDTSRYPYMSYIYQNGEYYLGILKGTPESQVKRILDGRRKYLKDYTQYEDMGHSGIDKFPKTFQTFQNHKSANSKKYQEWMRQYSFLKSGTAK